MEQRSNDGYTLRRVVPRSVYVVAEKGVSLEIRFSIGAECIVCRMHVRIGNERHLYPGEASGSFWPDVKQASRLESARFPTSRDSFQSPWAAFPQPATDQDKDILSGVSYCLQVQIRPDSQPLCPRVIVLWKTNSRSRKWEKRQAIFTRFSHPIYTKS